MCGAELLCALGLGWDGRPALLGTSQGLVVYQTLSCSCCFLLFRLIETMLVVDSQRRASLDEVAAHQWLQEGGALEEVAAFPAVVSNVDEIPMADLEVILHRMEQGGYGSMEAILK